MNNKEKEELFLELVNEKNKMMKEPLLSSLFFELTDGCNLHCLHCGSNCGPDKARYLDLNLIKKTLESVKNNIGTDSTLIVLTGGEPMLHPHFEEIIKTIDEMGFRWGMTTNGTLISEEKALLLKKYHMMSVAFSLDGNKEIHNKFRGSSLAYDRCIQGIKNVVNILGHQTVTMITSVIYKENINKIDELYEVCKELGVDYFRPINIEPIGRANSITSLFLGKEEFKVLFDYIKKKREEDSYPIVTYGCSHYLPLDYELDVRDNPFVCVAGIQNASILVNGDIYACLDIERRPDLIEGNVNKDDFYTIWKEGFRFFRKERTNCSFCKDCIHKDICKGDSAHTWNYDENKPNLCIIKLMEE